MRKIWLILILLCIFCFPREAEAGELAQRLAEYPQWERIKSVQKPQGDLFYPEWMMGEWNVKSTLIDLVAPLAPDIITPGFEGNHQYLNQPVIFRVKFVPEKTLTSKTITPKNTNSFIFPKLTNIFSHNNTSSSIVADRAFNGLSLARAYLGEKAVISVKVDPDSPNRQITFLRGKCDFGTVCDRQLVSLVKARSTEVGGKDIFTTCEVFQQFFTGDRRPYFNSVESTTQYHKLSTSKPAIEANQVTAVYLSPQDPNYFKAASHPVALYRYRLEFSSFAKIEG
ncbi:MAG: DUF6816 family protein [Cyanobacteria bacterium P01_A01_bin.84]